MMYFDTEEVVRRLKLARIGVDGFLELYIANKPDTKDLVKLVPLIRAFRAELEKFEKIAVNEAKEEENAVRCG